MTGPPDFDAGYRADPDPWQVASSPYEQRKLDVVLASLTQARYERVWDPGSGTGHLAARLADRGTTVLAGDASAEAVRLTRQTCHGHANVQVHQHRLPDPLPGPYAAYHPDLVVLSEFLYYLPDADRAAALAVVDRQADPTAELLAVHWAHVPDDAWLSGPGTQAEIVTRLSERGWRHLVHHRDTDFVLDVLRRGPESR